MITGEQYERFLKARQKMINYFGGQDIFSSSIHFPNSYSVDFRINFSTIIFEGSTFEEALIKFEKYSE